MTATSIEATEFMDLSRQYRVTGVPKTIINGKGEILGAVPEDAFVDAVVRGSLVVDRGGTENGERPTNE